MFKAALFIIVLKLEKPRAHQSKKKQTKNPKQTPKQLWYIHTMKLYSPVKINPQIHTKYG